MKRFRTARFWLAVLGLALIATPAMLSAQEDARRRAVGDWLVEDVADEEGRRTLSMTREADDYSLDYHLVLAPEGAAAESQGFLVWRLNCGQGGEESLDGGLEGLQPGTVRDRLAAYLARCDTPAGDAEALLRDFDRAFTQLGAWADDRQYPVSIPAAEGALSADHEALEAAAATVEDAISAVENAAAELDADSRAKEPPLLR